MFTKEERQENARTIINQLGGKRFSFMVGVKTYILEDMGVSFKFMKNASKSRLCKIEIDVQRDLYNVSFIKESRKLDPEFKAMGIKIYNSTFTTEKEIKGLYFDQLREIFSSHTGLALSL